MASVRIVTLREELTLAMPDRGVVETIKAKSRQNSDE